MIESMNTEALRLRHARAVREDSTRRLTTDVVLPTICRACKHRFRDEDARSCTCAACGPCSCVARHEDRHEGEDAR